MAVEALAPWASLLAAILSIGYIAADYHGTGDGSTGGSSDGGSSLSDFAEEHAEFLLVVTTTLILAVVAHVGLRGTAYFYPSVIWGLFALVVVTVAIDEVADVSDSELD